MKIIKRQKLFKNQRQLSIWSIFFLLITSFVNAQNYEADVTSTVKIWEDLTGNNSLYVRVDAACNNYDMKRMFPKIGAPTAVVAKLTNDDGGVTAMYEDKKFANQMLMFYEEGIWFKEFDGIQAVFIPLFYCSVKHGEKMPLSYIVLYDNQKYIYHFTFKCKPTVLGSCEISLSKSDLNKRLHQLPSVLKREFVAYIDKVYTTREDLFPNHLTFKNEKYKRKQIAEIGTASDNSYPHILLYKIHNFLEEGSLVMASVYLKEFEQLYVNAEGYVDVAGFNVKNSNLETQKEQYRRQFQTNEAELLQQTLQTIDKDNYQNAYLMLQVSFEELMK
ncbi:MAG: hypothetical protein LBI72_00410 [Flavobacteriaceae bacterium]|jgi:hypothetical protein|nr:hypothetical protein [Flavobacteriaceae bacterium]